MKPDPQRARKFAASISRPRLCGSAEERAVAGEVRRALEEAGLEVTEEGFEFRPVADGLLRLSLFLTQACLGTFAAGLFLDRGLADGGLAACVFLVLFLPWLVRARFRASARDADPAAPAAPGWIRASNVVGRAEGPAGGPLLVFVAHYDSKSQSLSLAARISLFNRARTLTFGFLGVCLARLLGADVPLWLVIGTGAGLVLLTLPLYALRTRNASPGALDNASGVGLLVELARVWKDLPASKKARAIFLAPSAEEFGMVGTQVWVRRHLDALRAEPRLRVLNFDGVGYDGPVWVVPSRGPATLDLLAAARDAGVELRRFAASIGLMTDHSSFTRERLPCATLLTHSWAAPRLHTPRDTSDTLRDEGFERVAKIALRAIEGFTS